MRLQFIYPAWKELELLAPMLGQMCVDVLFVLDAVAALDVATALEVIALLFVALAVVLVEAADWACAGVKSSPANADTKATATKE
jgi:hypothetical protein